MYYMLFNFCGAFVLALHMLQFCISVYRQASTQKRYADGMKIEVRHVKRLVCSTFVIDQWQHFTV